MLALIILALLAQTKVSIFQAAFQPPAQIGTRISIQQAIALCNSQQLDALVVHYEPANGSWWIVGLAPEDRAASPQCTVD